MPQFRKYERLTSRKLIQELFSRGQSFLCYPYRVTFMKVEPKKQSNVEVVLHVSKKNHKRAVVRNRIKRLMREAYRLNKADFYKNLKSDELNIVLSINYISKELYDFDFFEKKMIIVFPTILKFLKKEG